MIFVLEYPISGILNVYHCLIIVYHSNITDSKTILVRETAQDIFHLKKHFNNNTLVNLTLMT